MYQFKYKKGLLTKAYQVVGHNYLPTQDKMVLYMGDGGLKEIAFWSKCEATLGADWVLAVKAKMEKEAGTSIPINVG